MTIGDAKAPVVQASERLDAYSSVEFVGSPETRSPLGLDRDEFIVKNPISRLNRELEG